MHTGGGSGPALPPSPRACEDQSGALRHRAPPYTRYARVRIWYTYYIVAALVFY